MAGTGDVVMTDVRQTSSSLVLGPDYDGRFFVLGPRRQLVAELFKPYGRTIELGLEPGEYDVYFEQEQKLLSSVVTVREGQRQELVRQDLRPTRRVPTQSRGGSVELPARDPLDGRTRVQIGFGVSGISATSSSIPTRDFVHMGHGWEGASVMYWVRPDVALALDIGVTDLTVESTPTTDRTSGTFAFLAGARYYPPLSGIVRPYASAAIGPVRRIQRRGRGDGIGRGEHGHALRRHAGRRRGHALRAALHPRPGRAGGPRLRSFVALRRDRDLRVDVGRTAMMVLALAVLASQVAAPVEATTAVAVRGRVVDAQTGEAIAKATVSIPASKIEAATDGAGRFVLPGVPRGDVEIVVTTIGYGIARKTVRVEEGLPDVEIRVGQEASSARRKSSWRRRPSIPWTPPPPPPTACAASSCATSAASSPTTRCGRCSRCPASPPATTSTRPSPRAAPASRPSASTWTACS